MEHPYPAALPPRVLFAAPASGSGKTTVTCAVLQALVNRGCSAAAYKCGPDYVDPMFHRQCIGLPTGNLDLFFTSSSTARWLLSQSLGREFTLIEGVMGYYDGLGVTSEASSWQVARETETPTVLVVNCRGMSASIPALVAGFLGYKKESGIAGVILNQISPMLYPQVKGLLERELGIAVYGYLPKIPECSIESRQLGLIPAEEIENIKETLQVLASQAEKTIDLDGLLQLAAQAPVATAEPPDLLAELTGQMEGLRIGVAMDRAFCFYYQENLSLLEKMGAKLCYFSPMEDHHLPAHLDGLLLGSGYPELYAKELSANRFLCAELADAIRNGLPTLAECGGYMYLHQQLEGIDGVFYPMVGVVEGDSFATPQLQRFGYCELTANRKNLLAEREKTLRAHEFHYWDSTVNVDAFTAKKPGRDPIWGCMLATDTLAAGFPHLYWYTDLSIPQRFASACCTHHNVKRTEGSSYEVK